MPATIQLSRREREVAALVSEGLSNREIAERLFISERTAEGHVEQILNKLGFGKRAQIAAWVAGGHGDGPPEALRGAIGAIPRPLSSLVGRAMEIQNVIDALEAARLVTITGPGGIGKTRLALEAAARVESRFRDGAWFVELDSVSDGASVPTAVAHALKVAQSGGRTIEDELAVQLARREALVMLDNCEHVIAACAKLVQRVLSGTGRIRIMATARERLGIGGERVIALEPLAVRSDAVELLAQRCRDLGTAGWSAVDDPRATAICERLDGMPLAIELAAAQTPVLSLAGVLEKLDDRFRLLRSSSELARPRHQALEAAVDWSYQLLAAEEAAAFRRVSAFRGGFELDAAEALLGGEAEKPSAVELVGALIRKSMLVPRDEQSGERRYYVLETLREFARSRLDSLGESDLVRNQHAVYFLQLSEKAFARLRSADSDFWVGRLDVERGNLTAALEYLAARHDERFLRLVSALGRYWIRGRVQDGYRWTERAMRSIDPKAQADLNLLEAWAWLTWQSARSGPAFDALDLMLDAALRAKAEAMAGRALNMIATFRNDMKLPVDPQLWVRAEEHLRRAGEDWPLALLLNDIGYIEVVHGEPAGGLPKILEGLQLARRAGDRWLIALILDSVAWAYAEMGELDPAMRSWSEAMSISVGAANRYPLPNMLEGVARVARIEGDAVRACVLLAAAAGVRGEIGSRPLEDWTSFMKTDVELVQAALGDERFDSCWRIGVAMSAEDAVQFALARVKAGTASVPDSSP